MRTNLDYWKHSLENPEPPDDKAYLRKDALIVQDAGYRKACQQIRDMITTYCTLKRLNPEAKTEDILKWLILEIDKQLIEVKNIEYTEFIAYWKCLNLSHSIYKKKSEQERLKILEDCLSKYCENRQELYEGLGYTHTIQQALYDSASSRKHSTSAQNKLIDILKKLSDDRIRQAQRLEELERIAIYYFLPDKSKTTLNEILSHFVGKSKADTSKEGEDSNAKEHDKASDSGKKGKIPDIVIYVHPKVYIVEAKHIKEVEGSQDKQIDELIQFISQTEDIGGIKVSYVAFLDGVYFNLLISPKQDNKQDIQRKAIIDALKRCPSNYFVNTAGFRALFADVFSKESPHG